MRHTLLKRAGILLLLLSTPAVAQKPISVEREKVLAKFADVVTDSRPLYPVKKVPGRIFRESVAPGGAVSFRLHFKIERPEKTTHECPGRNPAGQPCWQVKILDGSENVVWTYVPTSNTGDGFWSDEVPGPATFVEVYSDEADSTLRLVIDRLAIHKTTVTDLAITYPDQRAPISTQDETVRAWGKAVARLRFISDSDKKEYFCTGFLASANLMLTNNHCIRTESEMRSAVVEFDYDEISSVPRRAHFTELVLTNAELDFTLLRLDQTYPASERKPLPWDIVNEVGEGNGLLIIEHPAGEPKQVSILDCRVKDAQITGVTKELTDFGHLCDTLGGSSGSAVQDINTGKVRGLHHLGFLPESPRLINRAVSLKLIYSYINKYKPAVVAELPVQ